MRAYFFNNMYLSSIQQGIQVAHVVGEMFIKYSPDDPRYEILKGWALSHKTIIVLNAGYSEEIHDLNDFFSYTNNPYPWAPFCESKEALDGATTSIGIILPEKIYAAASEIKDDKSLAQMLKNAVQGGRFPGGFLESFTSNDFNQWESEMVDRLNKYGLAK